MGELNHQQEISALEEWKRLRSVTLVRLNKDALEEWKRINGINHQQLKSFFRYHPPGKFQHLDSFRLRWLEPRIFDFVPHKNNPFSFIRYNGQVITPQRLFTDGGSIPRLFRWTGQLDPWQYTPAYLLHDWLFGVHHCNTANNITDEMVTFNDSADILMEAIQTMRKEGLAPGSDVTFTLIELAVSSFVAKRLWNTEVFVCPLPPNVED